MLPCSICGSLYPYHRACDQVHESVCHECFCRNMAGNTLEGHREHLAPAPTLTLTPREVAALVRYRLHRQAVRGTEPCTPLVTEED